MPRPAADGMAPTRNNSGLSVGGPTGEVDPLARRGDAYRRQDDEDEGGRRFRGGGGGDGSNNNRGAKFADFFRGGGGRGNNDDDKGDGANGGGNGGGGGGGGGNGGGGNGGGGGGGNGNGGNGGGGGDGGNNGNGGGGDGKDSGRLDGKGFFGKIGDGKIGDGKIGDGKIGDGKIGGEGFGFGFGFGFGRNGDASSTTSSTPPPETTPPPPPPSSSSQEPPPPPSTSSSQEPPPPPPSSSSTPPPPPPPPTTTSAEPPPSSTPPPPPPTTTEASSTLNPGVVLLESQVTASSTTEASPPATTSSAALSTSSAATSSSNEPEKPLYASSGPEPPGPVGPDPFPTTTLAPLPTGGTLDNGGGSGLGGGGGGSNDNNGGDSGSRLETARAGMDPTAERVLISVGSIGGFILVCFIAWMAWRTMKKPRRNGGAGSGFGASLSGLASKIPFLKQRGWQNLEDPSRSRSPPPSYRGDRAPSLEGFFASEKMQTQQPLQQPQPQLVQQPLPQPPQLPLPQPLQSHPMQPSWPLGALDNGMYQQPLANPANTYSPDARPSITVVTNMPVYSHQPQESFSSTNAAQFGAILGGNTSASPLQNGVSPLSLYNQPFQTQQYGPYNGQLYRQPSQALSEVSSLSSGFGDGEMMPAGSVVTPPAPTATIPGSSSSTSPGQQYTARFSWMSQAARMAGGGGGLARQNSSGSRSGRRETVYTESSEDQPARFRSVTSWVDQQTGRIRRVQQRGDGGGGPAAAQVPGNPGIPGIHNPPGEPSFGMMMDDEEMPRRVEEVVAGLGVGRGGPGVARTG